MNLCLKDVTKKCEVVRDVLDFVYELTQLIKMSTSSNVVSNALDCKTLINFQHTEKLQHYPECFRWRVMMNMQQKLMAWHQKCIILIPFSVWNLRASYFLLQNKYQAKDITVQEAVRGAWLLKSHLSSMRNEVKFNNFYCEVIRESADLTSALNRACTPLLMPLMFDAPS